MILTSHSKRVLLLLAALGSAGAHAAAPAGPASAPLASAIAAADLDPSALTQWVDGKESPMDATRVLPRAVRTELAPPAGRGVEFGKSASPGVRHLRIGFRKPLTIGAVLVAGGGRMSVLKPDRPVTSKLDDESAWMPAERWTGRGAGSEAVADDEYGIWVLPPGTKTQAIRFSYESPTSDKEYAGRLGGMLALAERWQNVAPQAAVGVNRNSQKAALLINGQVERLTKMWESVEASGNTPVVSEEHPVDVTLTWPRAMTLRGLTTIFAGFSKAEVQSYAGPESSHPAEASDKDWQTIAKFDNVQHHYTCGLRTHLMDFGKVVSTRAVRLRITAKAVEDAPALKGRTQDGKQVWLDEIMAMEPLAERALAGPKESTVPNEPRPPIPIKFNLAEPGLVTLVLDDLNGMRVRNLVSETAFPAGENVVWWDGLDDFTKDHEAASHGVYHIAGKLVAPGNYWVRGLVQKGTDLRYEFSVYHPGTPPWDTEDKTGGWMTTHTPATSVLHVPGSKTPDGKPLVYMGAFVAEGGHGLQWVDLDGKKRGGVHRVGGRWTGGPTLACDHGDKAESGVQAYVGAIHTGELRLNAMTAGTREGSREVLTELLGVDEEKSVVPLLEGYDGGDKIFVLGGLAAHNGLLVCTLPRQNQIIFVDARAGKEVGRATLPDPRGVRFESGGTLLILSGRQLRRHTVGGSATARVIDKGAVVISAGLEDPRHVIQDKDGSFYISDRGRSHQVKVFSPDGKPLRSIGHAGVPQAGPYDELHMNNPNGLTIDERGQLWVAENDHQPKRVSVWTTEGKLVRAFYGPCRYGGGGKIDPRDRTRFYYYGMEFALDWEKGTSKLTSIFFRPAPGELQLPSSLNVKGIPDEPLYLGNRRYFTNSYCASPARGTPLAFLCVDRGGIARPVAACGDADLWDLLQTPAFAARWPRETTRSANKKDSGTVAFWSDTNGDANAQPAEVTLFPSESGGVTVMDDGAFVFSRFGGNAVRFRAKSVSAQGVPVYDPLAGELLAAGVQAPPEGGGGDQVLTHANGWTVLTVAPKPFDPCSVCGVFKGQPRWSYPNLWPGLHASHSAPTPEHPGELIGTTRLLGGFVTPRGESGPLWFINGNMGPMYVFTLDGLFVRTLFHDSREGRPWAMPVAERNMQLNDVSPMQENFWPSVTQTADGNVYLMAGRRTSIVRVDGLDSIRRLPPQALKLSAEDIKLAGAFQTQREAARQKFQGTASLKVALLRTPPVVDGKLDEWSAASWAPIDKRGVKANFDSDSKPYNVEAAVSVAGDRLYAAFRVGEVKLLRNSGEIPNTLFKTGGALDLMLGTDSSAPAARSAAAPGDLRVIATMVGGRPMVLVYRAVVPGTALPKRIPFTSPVSTIYFDRVDDVSAQAQLAGADGNYELSLPLAVLGLKPQPGTSIKADIGILRGDGTETTQRVYWSNKATSMTADVPTEALLMPSLWGRFQFESAP